MNKEIKKEIEELKEKIQALTFKIENPIGFKIDYYPFNQSFLTFLDQFNKLKQIRLDSYDNYNYYKIVKNKKGNIFIEEIEIKMSSNIKRLYKFDIEREMLIQIKEEIINE